jgi:cephalosporin hydroxylase
VARLKNFTNWISAVERVLSSPTAAEDVADSVIADFDGDPRVAVVALLRIIHDLMRENRLLLDAASPGFARRALRGLASP